jgi:hypothetical protein
VSEHSSYIIDPDGKLTVVKSMDTEILEELKKIREIFVIFLKEDRGVFIPKRLREGLDYYD